jgi:succinoglycan biosynthesis transport protein ExoP
MNLFQILIILRARSRQIFVVLLLTVLATVAVSLLIPKMYRATSVVLLNFKGTDPITGTALAAQLVPGYMATQIDIATSKDVALKTVDDMGLTSNRSLQHQYAEANQNNDGMRDWLADRLLKSIDVVPSHDSSVMSITAKDRNPELAAAIANGIATAYQQVNLRLKVEPMQKASSYLADQVKSLRTSFEEAEQALAKFQQQHGLVNADNRYDVENTRLNELSSQLAVAQAQRMEADSREHLVQSSGGKESPDVIASPLIQNLKSELSQAEAKFMQLSQNLDKNHPQYQAAKAELDRLRSELDRNIANTASSVVNNANILRQRESEIRAALEAQKAKVLAANGSRDELQVLEKEADSAQRAYDSAMQRYMQTSMEGQSNQSDVSVLTPAVVPRSPYSPNLIFNIVVAGALGLMLGIAIALVAEMMTPRVRSANDLVEVLNAPVFGNISWDDVPRRPLFPSTFSGSKAAPLVTGMKNR